MLTLSLSWIQNGNAQQFGEETGASILRIMYGEIKSADLDGDGDQDLIVSGQAGYQGNGQTYIYLNNGSGGFSLHQYTDLPHILFSSIATGDIDNDGDIDLFLSGVWSFSGNYTSIFKNDGNANFTEVDPYALTELAIGSSIFFDVNGDGSLDLFYFGRGSGFAGVTKLYLNNGTGQFIDTPVAIGGLQSGSAVAEDYDKDGDLDLLVSGNMNSNGDVTKLFRNDGSAVFTEVQHVFPGIYDGSAVFSDIDNDDDLDIIVNGRKNGVNTYHSEFHLNDGMGNYTNVGNRGLDSLGGCSLAFADIDQDGDEDVFLTGKSKAGADTCALYYNQDGFFTKDLTYYSQGLAQGGALFLKMDNNCFPDLVYFGHGDLCATQTYCFRNNSQGDCAGDDLPFPGTKDPTYEVFSNPFRDHIRVEVSEKVLTAAIYDMSGRLIHDYSPDSPTIDIRLMGIANGIYNLEFTTAYRPKGSSIRLLKVE
jgi:hypothetical protein